MAIRVITLVCSHCLSDLDSVTCFCKIWNLFLDILDLLCTQVLNSSAAIIYLTDTERYIQSKPQITYIHRVCITASGPIFHQLLAASRRRRKLPNLSLWAQALTSINQATLSSWAHFNQLSNFELVSPFQSTKQLWAREPISINQATLSTGAHFNQPSNFERRRSLQSTKQLWAPLGSQHMAWDLFLLPASTADSTLLPHTKDKWTHIPLHPFWAWYPPDAASWPRYGHLVISQTVRRKSRSQWSILQFMNRLNCEGICTQKFSCFSAGRGHFVLACLLGCL